MPTSKNTIYNKISGFLTTPLPNKIIALRGVLPKLMCHLYHRHFFNHFGREALICSPRYIWNPQCISVGERTSIREGALMAPILEYAGKAYSPKIEIGKDVYIGPFVYIVVVGQLTIGDGTVLSENVYLGDNNHGFDPERGLIMQQELVHSGDITIGRNCFLGLRSAVMSGVTLGDHCIVGTGAVVTKSFPAYSMIGGVPAVLIKHYSLEERKWVQANHRLDIGVLDDSHGEPSPLRH